MRKVIFILMIAIGISTLTGCGNNSNSTQENKSAVDVVDLTKDKDMEKEEHTHEKNETNVSEDGRIYPKWKEINASTYLQGFNPEFMIDGDSETAYAEGMQGYGEDEWVEFISKDELQISRLVIMNGNQKSQELFQKSSRLKKVLIEFSNGEKKEVQFEDSMNQEFIEFEETIKTESIKITILEAYPGSENEDTCVTEMVLFH